MDRYQEILGLGVNGFNGVNDPDDRENIQCNGLWKQSERDRLAMGILQAESMREDELSYHLGYKYDHEEMVEPYNPVTLRWRHLVEIGVPTHADIQLAYPLVLGADAAPNDPVVLTITSGVTPSEVRVYYPGEDNEIRPSRVTSNGTTLTIHIPRARLVDPDYNDDRDDPVSYYDNSYFLTTVDVKRLYQDANNAAQYFWRQAYPECPTDCLIDTQNSCWKIASRRAYRLSTIFFRPASYSGGAWSTTSFSYSNVPDGLYVTYRSGLQDMRREMLTARLAHTLLPYSPCDCQIVNVTWEGDRAYIPNTYTPYGSMRGAVEAWLLDSRSRVGQGGKFPRVSLGISW
jgi:hypothetical protein